ncbi:DNA primase [Bacillus sp. SM2101]|uniref:DNA primase n=1 Tax=Bacillaceae TaxID=186817 RepID=UPI001BDF1397|nr:DNA primase [Bacillus sp. SM2101]
MGNRIPEEVIQQLHHSTDIVDLISEYVQLKKQGRNYFGLCPFHGEKSPSFSVSPEKQIYHCFGCGAGGNAFSFLMELEGLSFVEAAERLAAKVDVDVSKYTTAPIEVAKSNESSKMLEAHDLLKKFYHHLLVNTKEGQDALDYLLNRGITKEMIEKFEIGYALDSWDFISKFLMKRGFSAILLEKAGLIVKKDADGSFYDRFRNRIMFPIYDHQGRVVAFSGRVLGNEKPKYLNSPESSIFNKRKLLYNFHQSRLHIRKQQHVILFEGFGDVIAANKCGIEHSIATMGTSLTDEQARIIRRNVESITICYDSDNAGIEASFRASKLLSDEGCFVKIAQMPEGFDPDDYIQQYGAEKFNTDVIGASVSLMSFKMQYLRRGKNLQDEGERMRYIDEALKEISIVDKAVERDHYIRQLSSEFSISLDALQQQLSQLQKQGHRKKDNHTWNSNKISFRPHTQTKLLPAYQNAERFLIAHMLRNKDIAFKVQQTIQGDFNIEEHRAIITYLYAFYEEGNDADVSSFIQHVQDGNLQKTVSEIAMLAINDDVSEQELTDYINHVLTYPKLLKLKEKELEKQNAEQQKDFVKAATIANEIIQISRSLK